MTDTTDPENEALAAGYAALAAELGDLDAQFAEESHAAMLEVLAEEARTGAPPLPPDYVP